MGITGHFGKCWSPVGGEGKRYPQILECSFICKISLEKLESLLKLPLSIPCLVNHCSGVTEVVDWCRTDFVCLFVVRLRSQTEWKCILKQIMEEFW